jgi:uncharacterized surface protein with fasciclin (FAS1) repeats
MKKILSVSVIALMLTACGGPSKEDMMMKGDKMMKEGQMMMEKGTMAKDDKMMNKGKMMMDEGKMMVDKGMMMKDDKMMKEDKMMKDEKMMEDDGLVNPKVGGAAMMPTMNIIQNALNSPIHKTLVAAVQAAGLVETLSGPGPFTVFAPTDDAFGKLPAGTVDNLVKPENKATLTGILTYHVVAGKKSAKDLMAMNGKTLTTVAGGTLTVMVSGNTVSLKDAKGGMSMVTIADVNQSNGVIHVVDTVLMPK